MRHVDLQAADDVAIWNYGFDNALTIVTKDDDFRQRSFLLGAPPKVIWVRLGNCTTDEIALALRSRHAAIVAFEQDPTAALLLLSRPST